MATQERLGRRGLVAAAAALAAGLIAARTPEMVSATTGGTNGLPLIIGANNATGAANTYTDLTALVPLANATQSNLTALAVQAPNGGSNSTSWGIIGYGAITGGAGVAGTNLNPVSLATGVRGSGYSYGVWGTASYPPHDLEGVMDLGTR